MELPCPRRIVDRLLPWVVPLAAVLLTAAIIFIENQRTDEMSPAGATKLLRSEGIEAVSLAGQTPPGIGLSESEAIENAARTFAAFSAQKPEVHLVRITKNPREPEVTGPFYAFQLEGLGPGPVINEDPRRYLVLIDARDGSRTMGFPLDP